MSDQPTDTAPEPDEDAAKPDAAPDDAAETETPPAAPVEAAEADKPDDDADKSADDADKPEEPAKPSQGDRRFAILTAKLSAAERRAEAAEALVQAGKPHNDANAPPGVSPDAIRQAAREMMAEERANESRAALIAEGVKDYGAHAWDQKTSIVATLGATDNKAFMQAITAIPGAHRVVAALADDADALMVLLDMPPVAMAAKLGRMAAELDVAPKPKPLSAAPRPAGPVGGRTQAAPTIYDTNLSDAEYMALRNRTAPVHLGGQGKSR